MRYTEVRMQKITQALLTDLDKETVNFSPNYDGELMIPDVLPTRIPALLANGFFWYCGGDGNEHSTTQLK